MNDLIAKIRREYTKQALKQCETPSKPMSLFLRWLNDALDAQLSEPTAVVVGTVSADGRPSTRTVLLKGVINNDFIFFTNYNSRKGKQLELNPYLSLTFLWHELERQVHVEGCAKKLLPEISDEYFRSRPYKSRIAACVSPQSQVIDSRIDLIRSFLTEVVRYNGGEVKRPENWGGYSVSPTRIEFWQGKEHRLHDRLLYTLQENHSWKIERLAP